MLTPAVCDISEDLALANLRTQPLYFDGCFGWLHDCADRSGGGLAVVMCSGLKEDKVTGHRSFRLLADAFAARGYPTLRFDYRGTGNSRDIDVAEPWTEWQRNIHAAGCHLRRHVGAQRIVLCGLRIGATLAALVAQAHDDVDGLILLAPVIRGRTYIRQVSVETNVGRGAVSGSGLMLEDLWLSEETVETISRSIYARSGSAPSAGYWCMRQKCPPSSPSAPRPGLNKALKPRSGISAGSMRCCGPRS